MGDEVMDVDGAPAPRELIALILTPYCTPKVNPVIVIELPITLIF